tara:strand:+ start:2486 stop:2872 length:387 start_codon:yes stop_codon:yes gene_type:complete
LSYIKIFLLLIFFNQNKDIHIDPTDAYNQLNSNNDIILIDVRTEEEIRISKISGSINIDFDSKSFYDSLLTLNKSKKYFIYCRSGRRSTITVNYMRENGFHESYNVDGGINSWKNQNLDLKPKKKAIN